MPLWEEMLHAREQGAFPWAFLATCKAHPHCPLINSSAGFLSEEQLIIASILDMLLRVLSGCPGNIFFSKINT